LTSALGAIFNNDIVAANMGSLNSISFEGIFTDLLSTGMLADSYKKNIGFMNILT